MKQKILEILSQTDGYVSGQEICEMLGVSRAAVWKAVNVLRDMGYVIDSVTNKGYRLSETADIINADDIRSMLKTVCLGREIHILNTVDSTNNFAKALGHNGAKNGTVVIAREQTGGKGRLGRVWNSKKDSGLWMSLLLRPNISPDEISAVTPLAGLAVYRVLSRICRDKTYIKWPNDIIIENKKICGILTELTAEADRVGFIVIGIGINTDSDSFPEELSSRATSLYIETGEKYGKSKLAAEIINELEAVFAESDFTLTESALKEYKTVCANIGRKIGFTRKNENITGIAVDINNKGALVAECENGQIYELSSGEVTVSGIY